MPTATVIGAGPGGATVAIILARAGWAVTLVEQHAFPRDKVCGECLSHVGVTVLDRLGIWNHVRDAGAVPLTRTCLHASDGATASLVLPDPMWGLSRRTLDSLLLEGARRAGTRVLQPARAERVRPSAVTVRHLPGNTVEALHSDWILLADGRAALFPSKPPTTGDLGVKAHFREVDARPDAIALFGLPGHYVGVAPVEGGLWNVAYAVPDARVRDHRGDLDALFARLLRESPPLAGAFRHARRTSDWLASPLPRFPVLPRWPEGVIPLGNAAAALEPIGGEGMGLAMRSAELAAEALITAGADRAHAAVRSLPAAYRRLWRTRRPACRAGAIVLSRPRLASVAVDLLNAVPSLGSPSLRLVGK